MRKILTMMLAAAMLAACKSENGISWLNWGSGETTVVEKTLHTEPFAAIDIMGAPSVYYAQADSVSVSVKGPARLVERVDVRIVRGRLQISSRSALSLLDPDGLEGVEVRVASPDLVDVALSGSGDFCCDTPLDTDTLRLRLRGSGDVKFASVVCDLLDAELIGSGDIDVKQAETQLARLKLTGSGDIDTRLRNTELTAISLLGSGDIEVRFDNCREAKCALRGSGDIELSGSLEHFSEQKSGSGEIDTRKLSVRK